MSDNPPVVTFLHGGEFEAQVSGEVQGLQVHPEFVCLHKSLPGGGASK